jgi:hypothetical protein
MSARRRHPLTSSSGEDNLKQLQCSDSKAGDGPGEIEPPSSHEFRPKHPGYLVCRVLKSLQPALQGLCIVGPQVLDIENGEFPRLEDIHHLTKGRCIRTRENTFSCPVAEGTRPITSDGLEESASGMFQTTVNNPSHLHVVFKSNVFEHSYGHESVTLSGNVPIIIFEEFHTVAEIHFLRRA